jgi:predicted acyltransferase
VLEETAIGYLVTALILLNFKARGQLAALVALLLGYWALIALACLESLVFDVRVGDHRFVGAFRGALGFGS